jgi:hypothetical protein
MNKVSRLPAIRAAMESGQQIIFVSLETNPRSMMERMMADVKPNPFQALKVGDVVYYWFRIKGVSKRIGTTKLGYRGVSKVKVRAVGDELLVMSDGSVFERATGRASGKQELPYPDGLPHTMIPKSLLKPGRAKW